MALPDPLLVETSERHPAGAPEPAQLGDCVGDGARDLGVAIRGHSQQGGVDTGDADRSEDGEAREVGPLQVGDDDDQRLGRRGQGQGGCDLLHEPERGSVATRPFEIDLGLSNQLRHQAGEERRRARHRLLDGRFRRDRQPGPEHLNPRRERRGRLGRAAASPQRRSPPIPGDRGDPIGERGLPDAGLTRPEDQGATTGDRLVEMLGEHGKLVLTADKVGHGRPPGRKSSRSGRAAPGGEGSPSSRGVAN